MEADGSLLMNAFDAMELEAVAGLRAGSMVARLPLVCTVGMLILVKFCDYMAWLDVQQVQSVVYVSFRDGSQTYGCGSGTHWHY